jgi:hypothetical protein
MQTLNLSGETKKCDGRVKSLFWPTVDNAWDVDYLGQQGFWICLTIGILGAALLVIAAFYSPSSSVRTSTLVVAASVFFVCLAGGTGVRESSWPAAAMIFVIYAVNLLGSGKVPGVLAIILGAVLLSNVRAAFIASRWKPLAEGEDRPTRFNETFRDKLVDQLPPRLWPLLRIPFFIVSVLLLILLVYTAALRIPHSRRAPEPNEIATPYATLTVAPPSTDKAPVVPPSRFC